MTQLARVDGRVGLADQPSGVEHDGKHQTFGDGGRRKEKLAAAAEGSDAASFTNEERAALAYVSEIARTGAAEQSFPALRALFSERAIVELTWLQAYTTYLNRMARPLGIGSDDFCALRQAAPVRTPVA